VAIVRWCSGYLAGADSEDSAHWWATCRSLVPGVGAQGGDVEQLVHAGQTADGTGLIINSSRGILYASSSIDYATIARAETLKLRDTINRFRHRI